MKNNEELDKIRNEYVKNERSIPRKHYLKAFKKRSLSVIVKAKCIECNCFENYKAQISECTCFKCPLYPYRPYQTKDSRKEEIKTNSNSKVYSTSKSVTQKRIK